MFSGCESLTSLNLSAFKTLNVYNMKEMFTNCSKLEILNLSNFLTSKVTNMQNMFSGCESLLFLNLTNFDFKSISKMNEMFKDCSSLIYLQLDLKDYEIQERADTTDIFYNISKDITYCIKGSNTDNFTKSNNIISYCEYTCFNDSIYIFIKILL